uniref:J domain-containing protein n=1 Tax=Chenopodium quinoa TaxID=63459 RepID=A0A803MHL8_CHEQI
MLSFSLSSVHFKSPKTFPGNVSSSPEPSRFRRPSAVAATASPETSANSFYEVLEIPIGATNEEIKAAYRRLARSCHPDAAARGEVKSANEFIRVHAAYSVLSDPDKRADYDRKLSRYSRPPGRPFPGLSNSPTSSFCRVPRRNWETDQCW